MATEVVDHVVPHRGDHDLFWDEDNWQASCRWHHDVVKARLEYDFALGRVDPNDLSLGSDEAKRLTRLLVPTAI